MKYLTRRGHLYQVFKELISNDEVVILEAGAHFGEDSDGLLKTFPGGHLFCFEPDPRNIAVIKKYILPRYPGRMKLFECVLGDTNNDVQFYLSTNVEKVIRKKYQWIIHDDFYDMNLFKTSSSSIKKGFDNVVSTITVPCIKLDTWAEENQIEAIDLFWLDVQGAEKQVLLGGCKTLDKIRYLWIEYGAMKFEGAMDRKATRHFLEDRFEVVKKYSTSSDSKGQGDLLLRNRRLV